MTGAPRPSASARRPEIGVVVPTLNSGATLEWTLLSLRSQVDCDVEILVADSGSTDETLPICEKSRVPWVYVEPGNMYRAVSTGLRQLRQPWLGYLNSDDLAFGDGYSRLVAAAERDSSDVAYGSCDFVDAHGRFLYSQRPAASAVLGSFFDAAVQPFAQPAALFRREVFEALDGFDSRYRQVADFDFYRRAWRAGFRFTRVASPAVAAFRVHPGQLHWRDGGAHAAEKALLREQPAAWASGLQTALRLATWKLANAPNIGMRLLRGAGLRSR